MWRRDAAAETQHAYAVGWAHLAASWVHLLRGDWARANQWTLGYQAFCTASRIGFSGSCQLHRAEVLGIRGSLREALAHVNEALGSLQDDTPWAVGDGYRVLGDVHAAIGDAEAAYGALVDGRRVVPGDPESSVLYDRVSASCAPGASCERMPLGLDPLGRTEIEAIRGWIEAGAPR